MPTITIDPRAARKRLEHWSSGATRASWLGGLLVAAVGALGVRSYRRYRTEVMEIPVREFSDAEYPEDPARRSVHYSQYSGRRLTLVQKNDTDFDLILEPTHPHIAKIVFQNIDVSRMTPSVPAWTRDDQGLRRITLADRQWNRQQVRFDRDSPHLEVSSGDGFEKSNLFTAELSKNCLNAGLWEVLLFVQEDGQKALYYHGWFTFPLGHYKRIFEQNTGLPYWRHFYYLEHWFDPEGTPVQLEGLRQVTSEREVPTTFDPDEPVIAAGEQARKRRTVLADNVLAWKDFYDGRKIRFATFAPPGRYYVGKPWKNEFWRMDHFEKSILREVVSPATDQPLQELELVFTSTRKGGKCRFLVSGFDLPALPQVAVGEYPKGMEMPMGIGIPPSFQSYEDLQRNPPEERPFFSTMLDADNRWLNHHAIAVDGSVLHRDAHDPDLLHVYLLSYERHTLVGHFVVLVKE